MAVLTVYGIPNCDTVKRARAWLTDQGVAHHFHDFKKSGLKPALLQSWVDQLGCEVFLNRRGTSWRQLVVADQQSAKDGASAQALMLNNTSLIKRPVVDWGDGGFTVGFDADVWATRLMRLMR